MALDVDQAPASSGRLAFRGSHRKEMKSQMRFGQPRISRVAALQHSLFERAVFGVRIET